MTSTEHKTEAYKILFPVGTLIAFLGVAFWLMFQLNWIQFYPRFMHGNLMFFGFLWSFIAGFLMTAIPKMTSTDAAHPVEISIAIFSVFLQIIFNVRNLIDFSVYFFAIQNIFLLLYITRRFLKNKRVPFFGFIFIPVAFFQVFLGIALYTIGNADRNLMLNLCGEGFVLNLILGLGSRLIPAISRLPEATLPNEFSKKDTSTWPLVVMALLNVGFGIEIFSHQDIGIGFKIIAISIALIKLFRFFAIPVTWSYSALGFKFSMMMLLSGLVLRLTAFNLPIASMHLTYIGGFSLITLIVATRVMLAHGGKSLNVEVSAKWLITMIALFSMSAFLRFIAGTDVTSYWLSGSAIFFILSIIIWKTQFIKSLK